MVVWANEPYPDLNYDYNLPKEIKQIDRRIVKMLNEYFGILKVSCGTINVNTLHKMCLLKLLRDVIDSDGPLHVFMQQSEAKDWTDYIKRCFNELVYKDGAMDIDPEENICPPAPEPTPPGPDEPYIISISVSGQPTEFYVGTNFTLGDGVVTATYSDNSHRNLNPSEYTVSNPDMSTVGVKTVIISCQNSRGETKYCNYDITVSNKYISSIDITTMPSRRTFNIGDTLVFDGVVTGYYNTTGSLDVTSLVTFTGDDFSSTGTKTITVHYVNTLGQDLTDTYTVTVVNPSPQPTRVPVSLTLINPKTQFYVGDTWVYPKNSTSKIRVTYSDDSSIDVNPSQCVFTYNGQTFTPTGITANEGTKAILVSYTETVGGNPTTVSNSYTITVEQQVVVPTHWYIGTSDTIPTVSAITAGTSIPLTNSSGESPLMNKVVFWIAVPSNKSLNYAENKSFAGDYLYPQDFAQSNIDINGSTYKLYTRTYVIPANVKFDVYIQ